MDEDRLRQAELLVELQAAEIERLRARLAGEQFGDELRRSLATAMTAGEVAAPGGHGRLLEMILAAAAQVIAARSGALFLVDAERGELTIAAALGPKAEAVRELRLPLGHGIAGLVAVSGQPMAVSDAASDPRRAAEIGERVGYVPESILCVPLVHDEQVIGVLELLDKQGAASFSPDDIDALALFAGQAALAIEQSRAQRDLTSLVDGALRSFAAGETIAASHGEQIERFTRAVEQDIAYRRAIELARLVNEIAGHGEQATEACRDILTGFLRYLRATPRHAPELDDLGIDFGDVD